MEGELVDCSYAFFDHFEINLVGLAYLVLSQPWFYSLTQIDKFYEKMYIGFTNSFSDNSKTERWNLRRLCDYYIWTFFYYWQWLSAGFRVLESWNNSS